MSKATWNGQVLAESDQIIRIEGSAYFPPDSVNRDFLMPSDHQTTCPWRGETRYYDVVVNGETNEAAAWYYPVPQDGSIDRVGHDFTNYVAFWRGVEVV